MSKYNVHTIALTGVLILLPFFSVYWLSSTTWTEWLAVYVINNFIGIHTSIFGHRAWSHHAWKPSRALNAYGLFVFSLVLVGPSIGWVSVHREHHRYVDTKKDPHSPFFKSRWAIIFTPFFNTIKTQFVLDVLKDKQHMWFAKHYWHINIGWLILLGLISPYFLQLWLTAVGINVVCTQLINAFAHNPPKWVLPDHPIVANSVILSLLVIIGEAWHKNHHDDPVNWNFSKKWYQFDLGAWVIRLFVSLRIAHYR